MNNASIRISLFWNCEFARDYCIMIQQKDLVMKTDQIFMTVKKTLKKMIKNQEENFIKRNFKRKMKINN